LDFVIYELVLVNLTTVDLLERIKEALPEDQFSNVRFVNPSGCSSENCRNGVIGREVVAEIIIPNEELMDILKTRGSLAAKRYWKESMKGMTVIDHAIDKIANGVLAPDNAEKAVGHLVETY
jgi:type II secretory ATPase GspE/PulE/Tfp pilus assembly ATPase PilB-like protein